MSQLTAEVAKLLKKASTAELTTIAIQLAKLRQQKLSGVYQPIVDSTAVIPLPPDTL